MALKDLEDNQVDLNRFLALCFPESSGEYKCVLFVIEGKRFLKFMNKSQSHNGIVGEFSRELSVDHSHLEQFCYGGCRVSVDKERRSLMFHGSSDYLGCIDREELEKILQISDYAWTADGVE